MHNTISSIPKIQHLDSGNFFLICGPCAIESRDMALSIAEKVKRITDDLKIPYIFKGSYRKANRSSINSFTGIGDEKALKILREVGETFDLPTTTDIHTDEEAGMAAEYVDVLQIPAFLCRQTNLLVAAAKTGKVVNIKKGQFMGPETMQYAVNKVIESGNDSRTYRTWYYIRVSRSCGRFSRNTTDATDRCTCYYGLYTFIADA